MAQVVVSGIIAGCDYALIAFGFALIYNTTRTFHFAHGAIYSFSVYLWYALSGLEFIPIWLLTILTLVLTAVLGIAVDEVVYRPLVRRQASSLILLLSSLGVQIIILNLIILVFGNEMKILDSRLQPVVTIAGVVLSALQVVTAVCCLIIFAALALLLRKTRLGKTVRAMREDPNLVSALGINPRRVRWFAFGLGSALAGVAAILKGWDVGTEPNAGMVAFLSGAVAVIIGGLGAFEGVILGSLLLGVVQSVLIWELSGQWQEAITFLLLILFLLFRPEGIFGRHRRIEETAA